MKRSFRTVHQDHDHKINLFFSFDFSLIKLLITFVGDTYWVIKKAFLFASQSQNFGVHSSYFILYYYPLTGYMFPMHSQESPCMLLSSFYCFRTQNCTFWYSLISTISFRVCYLILLKKACIFKL